MGKDILKAIKKCEYILDEITIALKKLKSAKTWGMFDMTGRNSFFDIVKEKRMKEANEHIIHLKYALEDLRMDLYGVETNGTVLGEFTLDKAIIISSEEDSYRMDKEEIENTIRELGETRLNISMIYHDINIIK